MQYAERGKTLAHDTDLPFMAIVQRYGRAIPFRTLLETINRAHRKDV